MATVWFTSDTHWQHTNIIRYCNRPFADVQQMNEALIANWNSRVRPSDTIYHLGDFGFGDLAGLQRIFDRLNGRKHLIAGNHDKASRQLNWLTVKDYDELRIKKQRIILFHFPLRSWRSSHSGAISLYGHEHGRMPGCHLSLDVGTDCWNYHPVTLYQIQNRLKTLPQYKGYLDAG